MAAGNAFVSAPLLPGYDAFQKVEQASNRLGAEIGRELATAYIASLKAKSDVKIHQKTLETK